MENYKVKITKSFYLKLYEILDYNLRITFDDNYSEKIINEIVLAINSLNIFPYRFPEYLNDFRVFLFKKYKIFYKVNENTKIVTVYYIFGESEDYGYKIF